MRKPNALKIVLTGTDSPGAIVPPHVDVALGPIHYILARALAIIGATEKACDHDDRPSADELDMILVAVGELVLQAHDALESVNLERVMAARQAKGVRHG